MAAGSDHSVAEDAMMIAQKLPPRGRDFEVFSAVILAGKSTREAAAGFKLSQTRVCQIVERVRKWQVEVLGTAHHAEPQPSEERLLHLAKCIAAGRLDHLYGESMEAWRRSQGQLKKTRSSRYGDEVTTTSVSCGDTKYLVAAMRLSKAQAELPAASFALFPVEDGEELAGRPEARPTDHPEEDCSANRERHSGAIDVASANGDATTDAPMTSTDLPIRHALARRKLLEPVQAPETDSVTSLSLTPEKPGLTLDRKLTRQQRRRLKRMQRAG